MYTYTRMSILSGRETSLDLPISKTRFGECYKKWRDGALIQKAFPELNAEEREFGLSGSSPGEWAETFAGQAFPELSAEEREDA